MFPHTLQTLTFKDIRNEFTLQTALALMEGRQLLQNGFVAQTYQTSALNPTACSVVWIA